MQSDPMTLTSKGLRDCCPQGPLSRHRCTAAQAARLEELMEGHVAALVGGAVGATLARSRLSEVIDRIRFYQARPVVTVLC